MIGSVEMVNERTVTAMDDHCEECRLYGNNYSYDEDGDSVCNCCTCPFDPYVRGEDDD